jgi:hypothetical protein
MIFNESELGKAVEYISSIFKKGKEVKVTQYRATRTLSQNRLLWLWLACIEKETGNDSNAMKKYYQEKFLPTNIVTIRSLTGKELKKIEMPVGTSDLDTLQFTEFLDKIKQDAEEEFTTNREKPFLLPNPEDLRFKKFAEYYSRYLNVA